MKNHSFLFVLASVYGSTNLIPPPPLPMIEIIAYRGKVRESVFISHDQAAADEIHDTFTPAQHRWDYKNTPKPDSMKN